jgi:hypothetical protein
MYSAVAPDSKRWAREQLGVQYFGQTEMRQVASLEKVLSLIVRGMESPASWRTSYSDQEPIVESLDFLEESFVSQRLNVQRTSGVYRLVLSQSAMAEDES